MADKTVSFEPFEGRSFSITGSEADAGIVGELERSGGLYQRELTALFQRYLPRDAVVIDGGAHIGVVTILLAALCPAGHVYSFEPVPENHAHLRNNLETNEIRNVTVERIALYRDDGEVTLAFDEAYPGGSHVGEGKCHVPSTRLDTWARQQGLERLDLLKLDVEGVEVAVLDGAAETVRRFRPLAVVECNPVALPRFTGSGYGQLLRRMRSLFPVVGLIGPGGTVIPLLSERHLEKALNHRGVVDLVGLPARPSGVEAGRMAARGAADFARLVRAHNRWRPSENFVVDPGAIHLRALADIGGRAGEHRTVPVEIRNGTRTWLSSQFPYHPVHLSYRWFDHEGNAAVAEGHRTTLPEPLGPGRTVQVEATVQLPPVGGDYQLCLTMVQEHFAWLDEIDGRCTGRIPVAVAAGS